MTNSANETSIQAHKAVVSDSDFEQQMRDLARSSEHDISPDIEAKLAAARRHALSQGSNTNHKYRMPALATAFASIALVAVLILPGSPNESGLNNDDLLMANADLYEDLEFYEWMAENEAGNDNG